MHQMEDTFTFKCSKCGEVHVGPPDLAFDSPFYYHAMSEEERQQSAVITTDTCVIEDKDFFVRGIAVDAITLVSWQARLVTLSLEYARHLPDSRIQLSCASSELRDDEARAPSRRPGHGKLKVDLHHSLGLGASQL